jgi:hypothetical protein
MRCRIHFFERHPLFMALLAAALVCGLGACSSSTEPGGEDSDAPAPINDLTVGSFTEHAVTLTWTATGDDGDIGTASRYEVRRSDVFLYPGTWDTGVVVPGPPTPQASGGTETMTIDELETDRVYFFALTVFDDQDNSPGCSNCVEVVCYDNTVVSFADAALEAAVRAALGEPTEPLLRQTVRQLLELRAPEAGITDLDGLQECTGLIVLDLHGNVVSDLGPLGGLTKIFDLNLSDTGAADAGPLTGLTGMVNLRLAGNGITDLTPLAGMAQLEFLDAARNGIAGLQPLAGLDQLVTLGLGENEIADLTPLADLAGLTDLTLQSNAFTSVAPLAGLTGLTRLDISFNAATDAAELAPLTALTMLTAQQVPLSSSAFLSGMTSLRFLHLWNNGLPEVDGLQGLPALHYVGLSVNQITDLQPLVDNVALGTDDEINVSGNPLSATAVDTQIPALEARGVTVTY